MANYAYDRLTFLDNSFLLIEGPNRPMHVAGIATYETGPLKKGDGGIDIDRIREYVSARMHLIPRYRQRLAYVPLENQPVWVDDGHFNIHYHVRHTALPRPGDDRQLKRLAGRIMSQHLDRSKPLWEMWVVEGLEDPDHFAVISKIHHCMVDGMSSVDLLNVLLASEPIEQFDPPPTWLPRPVPSSWDLARDAALRYAGLPLAIARNVPDALRHARDPRSDIRVMLRAVRDTVGGMRRQSETPLNRPIGPHRRFDWLAMSLDDVKAVKRRLDGTLNDIVLATVAGAVRRFLERRRVNPEFLDFRVMAPVSMRTAEERGTLGNRVSAWIVPMPLAERDPGARLQQIRATTARLKESKQALGAQVLTQVGEWTPSTLLSLGAGMATRALPFNLVVTNVPGPQIPLYMLGARMLDNYGMVPLMDYLCLGIVLFSYAGKLCWGFTGEWDLLPDLHDFLLDIDASFKELRDAPVPIEVHREARKTAHAKRAARKAAVEATTA
jgi:diacylglycerol O-acyltransferase / wax synthase